MYNVTQQSDERLVVEIITKDKELFTELVKRYEDKLMRYAMYLLHNEQQALDVVQESFIKAYVNLQGFNTKKKFSSWIYRIVHNEAMNNVKKFVKETRIDDVIDIPNDDNVEDDFTKKEVVEEIQACINQMPLSYSEPIALFYLEEKSYEEISDILRIPMGTVATRINRGKKLMRIICQKNN